MPLQFRFPREIAQYVGSLNAEEALSREPPPA